MKTALSLLACAALFAAASAETVTLSPAQDGDVYSFLDQPTSTVHTLNVSASGEGAPHSNRSLIRFDFTALGIPADEIGTAVIRLFTYPPDIGGTGLGNVSIRRQGVAWNAPTLRWSHIQPQEEIALMPVTAMNQWVEADLTTLVKQWVAGSTANHGVVLMPESETSGLNVCFLSKSLPDTSYWPQLVITRAVVEPEPDPEPPVLSIALAGENLVLQAQGGIDGWTLQEADDLAGPWVTSTSAVLQEDGSWTVTKAPGGRGFFRLFKP